MCVISVIDSTKEKLLIFSQPDFLPLLLPFLRRYVSRSLLISLFLNLYMTLPVLTLAR